ncbi:hydroxymethylglutaryl-CoA lyase [Endozoicomonas sp. Mp262]|uniref:hydroxymethylglutaryl-CoA lyase n=1 Tax=Endozoicomonas sp. Mp262 TaxID=2919499 RepID=UPI0021DF879A
MSLPEKIKIVEVGPRDGLQYVAQRLSESVRASFVNKLSGAGFKHIEVGSFVSPEWVPQMAGSGQVFQQIKRKAGVVYSAVTPNLQGFEQAVQAGASEVAVFTSASEGFCQKNINCSIAESLKRFRPLMDMAEKQGIPVRGYVSCVMGCPYDGTVKPEQVVRVCKELELLGCYEVSLGDTIGVGTPLQAKKVFSEVATVISMEKLAAHFHNTYGQALANLYALLEEGLTVIDSAAAGLGGCPYAPGASGNVATEDVVYMLDGMGIETGVDIQKLLDASEYICKQLSITSCSNAGLALMTQ